MIEDIKDTLGHSRQAESQHGRLPNINTSYLAIFVKYISDVSDQKRRRLTKRFTDENERLFNSCQTAEMLAEELEDRDYYKKSNVFLGSKNGSRWESLRAQAKRADMGNV